MSWRIFFERGKFSGN